MAQPPRCTSLSRRRCLARAKQWSPMLCRLHALLARVPNAVRRMPRAQRTMATWAAMPPTSAGHQQGHDRHDRISPTSQHPERDSGVKEEGLRQSKQTNAAWDATKSAAASAFPPGLIPNTRPSHLPPVSKQKAPLLGPGIYRSKSDALVPRGEVHQRIEGDGLNLGRGPSARAPVDMRTSRIRKPLSKSLGLQYPLGSRHQLQLDAAPEPRKECVALANNPKVGTSRIAPGLFSFSSDGGLRFSPSLRMGAPEVTTTFMESKSPNEWDLVNELARSHFGSSTPKNLESAGNNSPVHDVANIETNSSTGDNNDPSDRDPLPEDNPPESTPLSPKNNEEAMSAPEQPPAPEKEYESESDSTAESDVEDAEAAHTPLSFQIPEVTLRAALAAPTDSPGSFYTHKLYRDPDGQPLSVHYCRTMEIANIVAPYFLGEKVLGFDIEWKPTYIKKSAEDAPVVITPQLIKENASLIQIASENRIALFHIALYKGTTAAELVPPALRTIIESPDIIKTGVAIKGDFSRLKTWLGVDAKGVFELSRSYNLVENYLMDDKKAASRKLYALAKQVKEILLLPLDKGPVRESDWSRRLDLNQISYAATDAYASYRLYDALEAKRKALRPIPPRPDLCDFDMLPRPKPAPKAPAAPKVVEKEEEEEESEYETAQEDIVDSQELEASSESESSSGSESSSRSEDISPDPDAEFVSPIRRLGRVRLSKDADIETETDVLPPAKRVGRLNSAVLKSPDPSYPTLPSISSTEESESDSDDAFDPPVARLKRRSPGKAVLPNKPSPGEDVEMTDAYAAETLDERLLSLSMDEEQLPDAERADPEPPNNQDQLSLSTGPAFDEEGDQTSSTADKDVKRRRSKRLESTATPEATAVDTPQNSPQVARPARHVQVDASLKSPEFMNAATWAQSYLDDTIPSPALFATSTATPSRIRATIPHLRAYHLWHYQHLSLHDIAGHLRDPPLAESTVGSYIVQAITLEKLEYENEALKPVLKALPPALRMTKYKWIVEKVAPRGL